MNGALLDIQTVFGRAVELESLVERSAYLDEACGHNTPFRDEIEGLLQALDSAGDFMSSPAAVGLPCLALAAEAGLPSSSFADGPGTIIGPYQLLERIGEGGMGAVFLAEQHWPVRRQVALKIIKPGMDTRHVVARFEAERQALALMDHPHIARILDAGATETGRPYFVMDLVCGVPVTEYADAHRLGLRERLGLFVTVCQAVQHAHQRGIIHRDLKPSNILVSEQDGRPAPKIIDFGIAKAVGPDVAEHATSTALGLMVGTPQYMSPEQSLPGGLDVDTRSDVYSLGAVLYELLTGSPPLSVETLRKIPFDELGRLIREVDPPRPSDRLDTLADEKATVAERRGSNPRQLVRTLRDELDWIVMKSLEKDRSRRYESPAELARDIERYLHDEPVLAGPPSLRYRLRKLVRRHRTSVAAGAVVLFVLIGGIIGTTIGLMRALEAEQAAQEERDDAIAARQAEAEAHKGVESAHTRTRLALATLTDNAISRMLGQQPEFGPQERRFLHDIERHYQALAESRGDSEMSRATQADGNLRLAQIRRGLGDLTAAERCARRALDSYTKLVADFPEEPTYPRGLAQAYHESGRIAFDLGQLENAAAGLRTALTIHKTLAEKNPGRNDDGVRLVWLQNNLGNVLRQLGHRDQAESILLEAVVASTRLEAGGSTVADRTRLAIVKGNLAMVFSDARRLEDAEVASRQSLDIWDRLAQQWPSDAGIRQGRTGARFGLARVLSRLRRYAEAERLLQTVLKEKKRVAADYPAIPGHQHSLANALECLGDVLLGQGRLAQAEEACRGAVAIHSKLAAGPQSSPEHLEDAAESLVGLAKVLGAQQRRREARRHLEQAVTLVEQALAANPGNPMYASIYHWALRIDTRTLIELGEHDAAARRAIQLARQPAARPHDLGEAIWRLIQCAGVVWMDPQRSLGERYQLSHAYADQAIGLVPKAVLKGIKSAGL